MLLGIVFLVSNLSAQPDKHVTWSFTSLYVQPGIYTIHAQVFIDSGWILFSQHEKNKKYQPTSFFFESNPLIKVMKIEEGGVVYEKDSCMWAYKGYADFQIKVVVKNRGEAILKGSVMYQPFDPSAPCRHDRWVMEDPFEIKLD